MTMSSDAWVMVGLHLRPRYLCRLIQVSKAMKLVDNEAYWSKVAAHLVWRHCDEMELDKLPGLILNNGLKLPVIEENLHYLLALDRGYYAGMEQFMRRIEDVIEYHSTHCQGGSSGENILQQWKDMKGKTFSERLFERLLCNSWLYAGAAPDSPDWDKKTMKMVAMDEIDSDKETAINHKFVCSIEDDPMPAVHKRTIIRQLHAILSCPVRLPGHGDQTDYGLSMLAIEVCKF
jgi:hypothetical protein